jgi:hypothetical protein
MCPPVSGQRKSFPEEDSQILCMNLHKSVSFIHSSQISASVVCMFQQTDKIAITSALKHDGQTHRHKKGTHKRRYSKAHPHFVTLLQLGAQSANNSNIT